MRRQAHEMHPRNGFLSQILAEGPANGKSPLGLMLRSLRLDTALPQLAAAE